MRGPHPSTAAGFSRWPLWRRWFGFRSERAAARFLRKRGYRIIAANTADAQGEIDLLALDGRTLVVVEVRSSESADVETLAASVNVPKQRRLSEATLRYLKRRNLLGRIGVRFDVLAIRWPPGQAPTFWHIPHAFESTGRFQFYN